MPMAISGHNGYNATRVGMSSAMSLSFYDEKTNVIEISKSQETIDLIIQRDENAANYPYQYVNATSLGFLTQSYILQNSFKINMTNVSLHIELKPINLNISYLIVMKLGMMPIINATSADYNSFRIFCPSRLKNLIFINLNYILF
jgi:hypothetical protein